MSTTYFAEGFPYTLVVSIGDVLFTRLGVSLAAFGLTSLLHMPWNLKLLWGPLIDRYETKRRWLLACELVIAALLVCMALATESSNAVTVAAVLLVALAFVSATQDVAIDGFYLEGLDEQGQSAFVGLRVAGYRAAMVAGSGGFLMVAGLASWRIAWFAAALLFVALFVFHRKMLPKVEVREFTIVTLLSGLLRLRVLAVGCGAALLIVGERRYGILAAHWAGAKAGVLAVVPGLAKVSVSGWVGLLLLFLLLLGIVVLPIIRRRLLGSSSSFATAWATFLDQPKVGRALALIVLFRLGESFLLKIRSPFLLREVGLSDASYGSITGLAGGTATIAAGVLAGWLISRDGLRRWLWPLVLAQNGLNLLYMGLALQPDPSATSLWVVTLVVVAENIGAGFGTAVFMVYIMRCCDARHRAAHMAIATSLMSIGFTVAGLVSGVIAAKTGYAWYFGITFLATLPGMALLPFVPHLDGRETSQGEQSTGTVDDCPGAEPKRDVDKTD